MIAIFLGAWVLGEALNPRGLLGGAIILGSVWLARRWRRRVIRGTWKPVLARVG